MVSGPSLVGCAWFGILACPMVCLSDRYYPVVPAWASHGAWAQRLSIHPTRVPAIAGFRIFVLLGIHARLRHGMPGRIVPLAILDLAGDAAQSSLQR